MPSSLVQKLVYMTSTIIAMLYAGMVQSAHFPNRAEIFSLVNALRSGDQEVLKKIKTGMVEMGDVKIFISPEIQKMASEILQTIDSGMEFKGVASYPQLSGMYDIEKSLLSEQFYLSPQEFSTIDSGLADFSLDAQEVQQTEINEALY